MARRKTTEDFIKEAKEVHGYRYDYSLVQYKNYITRVQIVCRKHGVFEQSLAHHIRGQGCPKCGGKGRTIEDFIREANEIHNNTIL